MKIRLSFFFIFFLLNVISSFAQIEMHGTDRQNESLVDSKKARRNAITEAFAKENRVAKSLNDIQGDRREVAKVCPVPSAWRSYKVGVSKAKEWDIVPSGVLSKTYPRSSGINETDVLTEFENSGDKNIDQCDYITVKFKRDQVETVDFSKCEEPEFVVESHRPCRDLLKSLAEKSRPKAK